MTRAGVTRLAAATAASVCLAGMMVSAQGGGRYSATLVGDQEVPAVSTNATGSIKLDIDEDGEEITYELSYSGLQGNVTQSHIHFGQSGVNGGIVLWLCKTDQVVAPVPPTCPDPHSGTVTGTLVPDSVQGTAANTQQINADEFAEAVAFIRKGLGYANVHTNLSPGGEIRGQILQGAGH
jgi:hypothetical protein